MAKIKLVVSATIGETFSDFIISKKTKGLAEKTLQSYQAQFQAVARHLDVRWTLPCSKRRIRMQWLSVCAPRTFPPNSINSYTRTLKSFFSWCNEQGITRLNIPLYKAEETVKETYSDLYWTPIKIFKKDFNCLKGMEFIWDLFCDFFPYKSQNRQRRQAMPSWLKLRF